MITSFHFIIVVVLFLTFHLCLPISLLIWTWMMTTNALTKKQRVMEDASFVIYLPISPNPPPRRGSSPPPTSPFLPKLSNLPDDCRVHLHGNDEDEAERGGDAYLAEDGHASEHAGHLGQVTCKVQHHHGHQRQPRRHGVEKQTPPPAEAASTSDNAVQILTWHSDK